MEDEVAEQSETYVVAARVRPFNERERIMSSERIVSRDGDDLKIWDPSDPSRERSFKFSHVFWSFDGFKSSPTGYLEPDGDSQYDDQKSIHAKVGSPMLDGFMKGHNASYITYGQTGGGKSYTLMGYGENKGLLMLYVEDMFTRLEKLRDNGVDYHVTVSMLEIYMEKNRDLLADGKTWNEKSYKVLEHKSFGVYVEGLSQEVITGASDMRRLLDRGMNTRTVAATRMNQSSSRSHMVTFINLRQHSGGITTESKIAIADLAGQEKVTKTGASGNTLKEGAMINRSLSSLSLIFSALAKRSTGQKKIFIPYRDSMMTRVLKDYLDGNAHVVMFINVSPSDYNYESTLSSLRVGHLCKTIKVNPVKNQYNQDEKIQELTQMVETLKIEHEQEGASDGSNRGNIQLRYLPEIEKRLQQMQEEEEILLMPWWKRRTLYSKDKEADVEKQRENDKMQYPHFWNLNEDQSISGTLFHFIKLGKAVVGMSDIQPAPEIVLQGLGIEARHCEIIDRGGKLSLIPVSKNIMVNGKFVTMETELKHDDRVWFAPGNLYVFHDPQEHQRLSQVYQNVDRPSFEKALLEVVQNTSLISGTNFKLGDDVGLQDRLLELIPEIMEVTAMATELKKGVKFEVVVVSPNSRGHREGKFEEMVKMIAVSEDGTEGNDWLWNVDKFHFRYLLMTEMYEAYVNGSKDWDVPQYKDPFWESEDSEKLLGTCMFDLNTLICGGYPESENIVDYAGKTIGQLNVQCVQCDRNFEEVDEELIVIDPNHMQGLPLFLILMIQNATDLPASTEMSYCRYRFYNDQNYTQTESVGGTLSPQFDHRRKITFTIVSIELSNYFKNETLFVEVLGKQKQGGASMLAAGELTYSTSTDNNEEDVSTHTAPDVTVPEPQMSQRKRRQKQMKSDDEVQNYQTENPVSVNTVTDPVLALEESARSKTVKSKDEENQSIKLSMEATQEDNRLRERIYKYIGQRGELGHTAIRIEDIVALLEGLPPPGRPVETEHSAATSQQSKACSLQ